MSKLEAVKEGDPMLQVSTVKSLSSALSKAPSARPRPHSHGGSEGGNITYYTHEERTNNTHMLSNTGWRRGVVELSSEETVR